jgi:hypothetical protein
MTPEFVYGAASNVETDEAAERRAPSAVVALSEVFPDHTVPQLQNALQPVAQDAIVVRVPPAATDIDASYDIEATRHIRHLIEEQIAQGYLQQ